MLAHKGIARSFERKNEDESRKRTSRFSIFPHKTIFLPDAKKPRLEERNSKASQEILKEVEEADNNGTGAVDPKAEPSLCDNIECGVIVPQNQLKMCEGSCQRLLCESCRCRGCTTKDCENHHFVCSDCFIGCRRKWQDKVIFLLKSVIICFVQAVSSSST